MSKIDEAYKKWDTQQQAVIGWPTDQWERGIAREGFLAGAEKMREMCLEAIRGLPPSEDDLRGDWGECIRWTCNRIERRLKEL